MLNLLDSLHRWRTKLLKSHGTEIKKRPVRAALKEARGKGISGKAMQDEVGAETQTLELGESTILEEDKIHLSLRPLLGVMVKSNLGTKALALRF